MTSPRPILAAPLLTIGALLFGHVPAEEIPRYVGTDNCKMCHTSELAGRQYALWRLDRHSIAFWTLSTPKAMHLAKRLKLSIEPVHNPQCLKCHTTAFDQPVSKFSTTFRVEDGVQCEACHGPGSLYSRLDAMLDPAKSRTQGLLDPDEKLCRSCHNPESPTFKGFDYRAALQIISHVRTRWEVALPTPTPAPTPLPTQVLRPTDASLQKPPPTQTPKPAPQGTGQK